MSENRVQKEPSTEEILGSIRRIISEDNEQAGSGYAADAAPTMAAGVSLPADDMAADDVVADETTSAEMVPQEMALEELELGGTMPADSASTEMMSEEIAPLEETFDEEMPEEATAEVEMPVETMPVDATPMDATPTTDATPMDITPMDNMDAASENLTPDDITMVDDEILELTDEVVEEEPVLDIEPETAYQPEEAIQPEEVRREPRFGLSAAADNGAGEGNDDDDRREPLIGIRAGESPDTEQQTYGDPGPASAPVEPLQGYNYSAQVLSSNQNTAGQEEHSMASSTDGEPDAPENEGDWETNQPSAGSDSVQDEIVSQAASTATASALGDLTRAVSQKTDKLKVGAETTVSDIVKEMLRPMLREWLDENLPLIVDRVVRREIQKLVDRTQDDE